MVFQPCKLLLFKKLNVVFKTDEKVHPWSCYPNKHAGQLEVTPACLEGGRKAQWKGEWRGERLAGAEASDPLERQPFITDCPEAQGVLKFWKLNNTSLKPWLYSRTWQILWMWETAKTPCACFSLPPPESLHGPFQPCWLLHVLRTCVYTIHPEVHWSAWTAGQCYSTTHCKLLRRRGLQLNHCRAASAFPSHVLIVCWMDDAV